MRDVTMNYNLKNYSGWSNKKPQHNSSNFSCWCAYSHGADVLMPVTLWLQRLRTTTAPVV